MIKALEREIRSINNTQVLSHLNNQWVQIIVLLDMLGTRERVLGIVNCLEDEPAKFLVVFVEIGRIDEGSTTGGLCGEGAEDS